MWTASGTRPIAQLAIGDVVHAWDEELQCVVRAPIIQTYYTPDQQVYNVGFSDGSSVECTASHPFYVETIGWVPASELDEGMRLRTFNGSALSVRAPPVPAQKADVYNIEVAGAHTYFVGSGALVHNTCSSIGARTALHRAMNVAGFGADPRVIAALRAGQKINVHHVFPFTFANRFFRFGLNVNEAKYGVHVVSGHGQSRGLPGNTHFHWGKAYNDEWETWLAGIEREAGRRKISPAEFQRRAEGQAKLMAGKAQYDPFGNASTSQATGFLSLLHF